MGTPTRPLPRRATGIVFHDGVEGLTDDGPVRPVQGGANLIAHPGAGCGVMNLPGGFRDGLAGDQQDAEDDTPSWNPCHTWKNHHPSSPSAPDVSPETSPL